MYLFVFITLMQIQSSELDERSVTSVFEIVGVEKRRK
jgi:hypothetical protein